MTPIISRPNIFYPNINRRTIRYRYRYVAHSAYREAVRGRRSLNFASPTRSGAWSQAQALTRRPSVGSQNAAAMEDSSLAWRPYSNRSCSRRCANQRQTRGRNQQNHRQVVSLWRAVTNLRMRRQSAHRHSIAHSYRVLPRSYQSG
jgi:hypothetical protein